MASPRLTLAFVAISIAAMAPAMAQQSPMPSDISAKLQEIGRVIDPPKTAAIYIPLQAKELYPRVKVESDVKYGPADRNLLDVFIPEAAAPARPVLIFVHGGGFVAGNKHAPGSPFYDNIMLWAVKSGFVGVNMEYPLAPQSPWPAGAQDIASVVQWVSQNIASRGGDPAKIYLMGHSAGASHVAGYVSHPEFYKVKDSGLAGAIMVSGIYQLDAEAVSDNERAYYSADPSVYAERSSLQGLLKAKTPIMITAAELDPPRFVEQLELTKDGLCKSGHGCAHTYLLPQHSHMSEVYSINTPDTRLTDQILDFIKSGK